MNDVAAEPEAEETFMPVTQTINPLSDIPTTDHKALVVRLELDYVEYAKLENLVKIGIASLAARKEEINTLRVAIRDGQAQPPAPLNANDITTVYYRADDDLRAAELLYETMKRPPRL